MDDERISMTPDQLGYKDRGKMKWMGLILSEQTDLINEMERKENAPNPEPKELMTENEISSVLEQAYVLKAPILLQANTIRDGHYYSDLKCIVLGFQETSIYFRLKDGRMVDCEINQIRNVEFMDPIEWFDK